MSIPMTPPKRTKLDPIDAVTTLWFAHQNIIGGPCPMNLLKILSAQSAFETDTWRAMWNYNFGNLRGKTSTGAWTSINGASEIIDGKEVFFGVGADNQFKAYPSAIAGAESLVRYLGVATKPPLPNRYLLAWDSAIAGDIGKFCAELRANGYFTANLAHYTHGVRRKYDELGPIFLEFENRISHPEEFPLKLP